MRNGLAESLSKWLAEPTHNLAMFEERRVVVVGIVGKASSDSSKADPINHFLGFPVFVQRIPATDSTASIEAYYESELSVLFLHLTGYGDLCSLEYFLQNSDDEQKGFFELLSRQEVDYLRCLTFLLLYSHLLIYMEPGCRFDQSCCRDLKRANELRRFCQTEIQLKLSAIPDFPQSWSAEGRLSQPRCLFAFHRHLLRGDLNSTRKRELKSKLVEKLEQQIYRCMQLYGLIASNDKDYPCSLPKSAEHFVHLFPAEDSFHDDIRESLLMLIERGNEEGNDGEKEERSNDFDEFFRSHIDLLRQDEKKKYLYEIPKLKWLLTGGKIVYDELFQKRILSDEKIYKLSSTELQFSKSMESTYIGQAKAVYQNGNKDTRDLEKRKPQVFTKAEHEAKLARAVEHLECIYHGTELEKAKEKLKQECETLWATQKACEFVSLTGNECILPIHYSLSDVDVPASKRIAHSSKARFLSTCNCGHSQALRNDPFSLREANHDFYIQSQFTCCKNMEAYEFEVFKYDEINEGSLDMESLPEKSQKSIASPEYTFTEFSSTSIGENDLKMLLDRDNPLEDDEVNRESIQSSFKIEDTDTDDAEKELEEKKISISSETEKCGEEQTPEELENNDEEDDEEYVKVEEAEQQFLGMRRHRAHMDDYESWSQEDEEIILEAETQVSYLDDDDVQLRDRDTDSSNKFNSAINFEEELVKLRKLYKGLFLECVPNTESPSRKPLFPSWSLLCLGASSLYSHKGGLRDMPNFKNGTQFLLPVDVFVTVEPEKWEIDMKEIMGDSCGVRSKRPIKMSKGSREKVKLFVGFEYECPRGHRFMYQDVQSNTRMKAASNSKESGSALIRSDLPLWTKCTCRRLPQVGAQLMRLHVVTPKAPVTVILNPRVQPASKEPVYHTGEAPIHLEWARYYILRFPYVYAGPHGPVQRPNDATMTGKLLANCIEVQYIPKH